MTSSSSSSVAAAENYHLKWDSHLPYLNHSVATLYKNEKFADVILLPSHPHGGGSPGIAAHRIILSSCSQFFAGIFDNCPSPLPHSLMYVVLPPELSKRAIQILIQYMYCGEATVSNDILKEVLRGGEILKIRGLYRSSNGSEVNNHQNISTDVSNSMNNNNCIGITERIIGNDLIPIDEHHHKQLPQSNNSLNNQRNSLNCGNVTCIRAVDYMSKQSEFYGLGASVLPKESPVIVKSPKPAQYSPFSIMPLNLASSTTMQQSISVNKDLTIDSVNENSEITENYNMRSYSQEFSFPSQQLPSSFQQNASSNCPRNSPFSLSEKPYKSLHQIERDKYRRRSEDIRTCTRFSSEENSNVQPTTQICELRRTSLPGIYDKQSHPPDLPYSLQNNFPLNKKSVCTSEHTPNVVVKEEPLEWQSADQVDQKHENSDKISSLDIVKMETEYNIEEDEHLYDREHDGELIYSPLTCELCGEVFTVPAEWVRHIDTHMDTAKVSYLPKKKRKTPLNPSTNIVSSLKCDLCSTLYSTPSEWVKHIQTEHTETELATYNKQCTDNGKFKRKPCTPSPDYIDCAGKICEICNKKFSSYASMTIHKRTHTGEKPFICSPCNKGFNVKSNLLRHMRTLHNKIFDENENNDDNH